MGERWRTRRRRRPRPWRWRRGGARAGARAGLVRGRGRGRGSRAEDSRSRTMSDANKGRNKRRPIRNSPEKNKWESLMTLSFITPLSHPFCFCVWRIWVWTRTIWGGGFLFVGPSSLPTVWFAVENAPALNSDKLRGEKGSPCGIQCRQTKDTRYCKRVLRSLYPAPLNRTRK